MVTHFVTHNTGLSKGVQGLWKCKSKSTPLCHIQKQVTKKQHTYVIPSYTNQRRNALKNPKLFD